MNDALKYEQFASLKKFIKWVPQVVPQVRLFEGSLIEDDS